MKFNPTAFITKLFDNKKFLIAFSVVLAVIFWLVIEITENPSRDVVLSGVPITLTEQTDDNDNILSPVGEYNEEVTVTVSGPGYIVGSITKDDITVSVSSYAEVTKPGTYVLNLTANASKSGCTVSKISPSYVQVSYAFDASADIPVEIDTSEFQQYVSTDCEIYKSNLKNNSDGAEISALTVSGPSEIVGSIAKVVIKPDLSTAEGGQVGSITSNFKGSTVFYDAAGAEIDGSSLKFNRDTYVRIIVYKTAEVKLVPTFTNLPEHFAESETGLPPYTLSVYDELMRRNETITEVTVKGPIAAVDDLVTSGLQLSPIDFSKVTPENTSFNVSFVRPEGVEVVDGTEEVTVLLELGALTTKTVTVQPSAIGFVGLDESLTASSSYKMGIKVVICGRYATLRGIDENDISVTVDCSGITSATVETRALKVAVKDGIEAWVNLCEPFEVSVTIK